jgi:uncharacterized protein involved in exopolysaccharide biosynthesis
MNDVATVGSQSISLGQWLRFLKRQRLLIVLCVLIAGISGAGVAFLKTPQYQAEVVFMPIVDSGAGQLGQLAGNLGGLASLVGINVGSSNQSDESLEYLRSRSFARGFIERHNLMPLLFAPSWDSVRGNWRSSDKVPTMSAGVEKFTNKIRTISEDRRAGTVTLNVTWSNREVAARWANAMLSEADAELRERAQREISKSIEYLKEESAKTTMIELRGAIFKVMEAQLKNSTLARTRDAYAFRVVDPATIPDADRYVSPNRPLVIVLALLLGLVFGIGGAAVRELRASG